MIIRVKLAWAMLLLIVAASFLFRLWQLRLTVQPGNTSHRLGSTTSLKPSLPHRPEFQSGIVFPQWGSHAYRSDDANWTAGLHQIQHTHARWISLILPLHMATAFATQVETRSDTPTTSALASGIAHAHAAGLHVLLEPLITLDGPHAWEGYISFSSPLQAMAWFNNYEQTLTPYLMVAQQYHADVFSVGNECDQLDLEFPDLWRQLFRTAHETFSGKLIYSLNWASLAKPLPTWLTDPNLDEVGVSSYFPVTPTPQYLTEAQAVTAWKQNVESKLDTFAQQVGKPVVLTEIGYMDTHTAGYTPWQPDSSAHDDQEQAILYQAAMQNISTDPFIAGTYWWAWGVPAYTPYGQPAGQTLTNWYAYLSGT